MFSHEFFWSRPNLSCVSVTYAYTHLPIPRALHTGIMFCYMFLNFSTVFATSCVPEQAHRWRQRDVHSMQEATTTGGVPDAEDHGTVAWARLSALGRQASELTRNAEAISCDIKAQEKQLRARQQALAKEMKDKEAALLRDHSGRVAAFATRQAEFEEEKAIVAPAVGVGALVRLNVGGTHFEAKHATLAQAPGFFGALVSGRHRIAAGVDGAIFIERDPTHFRHILSFLSTGRAHHVSALPKSVRQALAVEADYFGLDALLMLCRGTDHAHALSEGDAAIRRAENGRRAVRSNSVKRLPSAFRVPPPLPFVVPRQVWSESGEAVRDTVLADAAATPLPTSEVRHVASARYLPARSISGHMHVPTSAWLRAYLPTPLTPTEIESRHRRRWSKMVLTRSGLSTLISRRHLAQARARQGAWGVSPARSPHGALGRPCETGDSHWRRPRLQKSGPSRFSRRIWDRTRALPSKHPTRRRGPPMHPCRYATSM